MTKLNVSCLVIAAVLILQGVARADDVIYIRVRVHAILNPANGMPPLKSDNTAFTDADVDAAIANENTKLQSHWRGFRLIRSGSIVNVGGTGGYNRPNPSAYFNVNWANPPQNLDINNMDDDSQANQALWAFSSSALNIYVTGFQGCRFKTWTHLIGGTTCFATPIHEVGHYFGLCHTQGCGCECCPDCAGSQDDGIADTILDSACWLQDDIAQHNYGHSYAASTPAQQSKVDDVFYNIMSYHNMGGSGPGACGYGGANTTRFTEGQLDKWTDTANGSRLANCTARTFITDVNGDGTPDGSSGDPCPTVTSAVNLAATTRGDIIMMRPGTYSEHGGLVIHKHVTLRATHKGPAIVQYVP